MLDGYPMVPGEFVQNPFPAKSPDAAVLLPAESTGWRIVHAAVVDVGHAGLHAQCESHAAFLVTRKHRA